MKENARVFAPKISLYKNIIWSWWEYKKLDGMIFTFLQFEQNILRIITMNRVGQCTYKLYSNIEMSNIEEIILITANFKWICYYYTLSLVCNNWSWIAMWTEFIKTSLPVITMYCVTLYKTLIYIEQVNQRQKYSHNSKIAWICCITGTTTCFEQKMPVRCLAWNGLLTYSILPVVVHLSSLVQTYC